jgi:hypothetical protein
VIVAIIHHADECADSSISPLAGRYPTERKVSHTMAKKKKAVKKTKKKATKKKATKRKKA